LTPRGTFITLYPAGKINFGLSGPGMSNNLQLTLRGTFITSWRDKLWSMGAAGGSICRTRSEVRLRFDPRYSVPGQIGLRSCQNQDSTESDRTGLEICRSGSARTLESDRCNVGLAVSSTDMPEKLQEKLQENCRTESNDER